MTKQKLLATIVVAFINFLPVNAYDASAEEQDSAQAATLGLASDSEVIDQNNSELIDDENGANSPADNTKASNLDSTNPTEAEEDGEVEQNPKSEPSETKKEDTIKLNQESVVTALKSRFAWIKKCYANLSEEEQSSTPDKVTANFVIGKFGQVKRLSFENDLPDNSAIQRCFTSKLLTKRFPKPKDRKPVRISFPVIFKK